MFSKSPRIRSLSRAASPRLFVRPLAAAAFGLILFGLPAADARASEANAEATPAPDSVAQAVGTCAATDEVLCLHDKRYAVTVVATNKEGMTFPGRVARPRTRDSGVFYFFAPDNWEMLLKVLDGCGFNQHHWVYAASATDVGLELTVKDTTREGVNASKTYTKEVGPPAPAITDIGAFPGACAAG